MVEYFYDDGRMDWSDSDSDSDDEMSSIITRYLEKAAPGIGPFD
jgi:hypothetical protein